MAIMNYISEWKAKVLQPRVTGMMNAVGRAWVEEAVRLAPEDTGYLKSTIGYIVKADGTVQGYCDAPYGMVQEYGNSRTPAHPFMRPALLALRGRNFAAEIRFTNAVAPAASTRVGNPKTVKANEKVNKGLSRSPAGRARVRVGHE